MGNERLEFNSPSDPNGQNGKPEEMVEVSGGVSQVASSASKNVLLFAGMLAIVGMGVYFIWQSGKKTPTQAPQASAQSSEVKDEEEIAAEKALPSVTPEASPSTDEAPSAPSGVIQTPEAPAIESPFDESAQFAPPVPAEPATQTPDVNLPDPFIPAPKPTETAPEEAAPAEPPSPDAGPEAELPAGPVVEAAPRKLSEEERKKIEAQRSSSMRLFAGSDESSFFGGSSNQQSSSVAPSGAAQARATFAGRTDSMIAQGKMIDAVLETAINTDLPGVLRAVVSRDVYAESGRLILIPRGSRLIGNYDSDVKRGQQRVYVIWSRIIRPDGIDLAIDSPGTDALGRSGIRGVVDSRYFEIFGNSVLLSSLTIAGAFALEKVTDSQGVSSSTTTSTQGTTSSQSGKPTDLAISKSVSDIGDVVKSIAEGFSNVKPTITVDQGTRVNVFVNRDLIFPASALPGGKVIVP